MTIAGTEFIKEALAPFCTYVSHDGRIAVRTHCLYPSNAAVTVYVTGSSDGACVSDEGGAIDTLVDHNRKVPHPEIFLRRFCQRFGLEVKGSKITSPPVPQEQLTAAILLVANASAAAAHWGLEHLHPHPRRNLRQELYRVLLGRFSDERIENNGRLTGKSARQYRFDHVVKMDNDRILVVDAVLPDANSINSHAIAHFDLANRDDRALVQRLVYDEADNWKAADLNLLQMAATLVPLSGFKGSLDRLIEKPLR